MSETNRNWEIEQEGKSLILFINPKIFPLSVVKKVASQFQTDHIVNIDGDPSSDILVRIFPRKGTDFDALAQQFNAALIELSAKDLNINAQDHSLVSRIRALVSSFIKEERGNISKESVIQIGALLAAIGIGGLAAKDVSATHCDCSTCGEFGGGGGGDAGNCRGSDPEPSCAGCCDTSSCDCCCGGNGNGGDPGCGEGCGGAGQG